MLQKTVSAKISWPVIIIFFLAVGYLSWSNAQKIDGAVFSDALLEVPKVQTENDSIKIAKPRPRQYISSPLVVLGEANVFEATYNYRLKDASNNILAEGFGMTAGAFEMNPFREELSFLNPGSGEGLLEVFEISAKDGSEQHKISIPVFFTE